MKELNRGGEVFCGDVFGWFGRRIQKLGLAFWPAGLDDRSFGISSTGRRWRWIRCTGIDCGLSASMVLNKQSVKTDVKSDSGVDRAW